MYKTKYEFMDNLEKELNRFGVVDKREIITDFQQHFTNGLAEGLTEAEICSKLGDISDIAKSYAEEEIFPAIAVEPPPAGGTQQQQYTPPPFPQPEYVPPLAHNYVPPPEGGTPQPAQNNSNCDFNGGGLAVCIIVDILVLSWALPALFGIIVGLLAAPIGLVIGGIATIIGGAFGSLLGFFSPLPQLATVFLGLMLVSIGVLLGLAGVALVKVGIKAVRAVIDWHGTMITGKPVFEKKGAEA